MDWLEFIYEEHDLDIFLNKLEKHYRAAFWVMDNAFNLKGASHRAKNLFDEWTESKAIIKIIESLQFEAVNQRLNHQECLQHYSKVTGTTSYIGDCVVNHKRLAKVTCFYDELSHITQADFLDCLKAITIFLQMNQQVSRYREERNNFFHNLLQIPNPSQQFIDQNLYYHQIKLNKPYLLLAATELGEEGSVCGSLPYYLKILKTIFTNALFDSDDMMAIVYVSAKDFKEHFESLTKACRQNKMKLLIGIPFEDEKETYFHYQQLKRLLNLSPSAEDVSWYREYVIKDVLSEAHPKVDLKSIVNLQVQKLYQYDKHNHTEYFETAYYLVCKSYTQQEISKLLNIHINTLKYRMKQLERLFDLDLEKSKNDDWIRTSFHIVKYMYM